MSKTVIDLVYNLLTLPPFKSFSKFHPPSCIVRSCIVYFLWFRKLNLNTGIDRNNGYNRREAYSCDGFRLKDILRLLEAIQTHRSVTSSSSFLLYPQNQAISEMLGLDKSVTKLYLTYNIVIHEMTKNNTYSIQLQIFHVLTLVADL